MKMTLLDLFSGIGGFTLAASRTGMIDTAAFCENNKAARRVLREHYPGVPILRDIRELINDQTSSAAIDIISGGDPRPIRSRARQRGAILHPDMSGHFLAVVARFRPRWVVRENVLAPDDVDFATALDVLGYRCVVVRTDAATFTGQSRQRDIIIGCVDASWPGRARELSFVSDGPVRRQTRLGERAVVPNLTTRRARGNSSDCYIFDGRFRVLDATERVAVAGYPEGWLGGLSEATVARLCGNTVTPQVLSPIFNAIVYIETKLELEVTK